MSPDNLVGLAIFGTAALALLAGLGAWAWEILSNRKTVPPSTEGDVLGAAMPRPEPPKPILPRKDIKPLPGLILPSKQKVDLPLKTPSSPPSQIDETKSPSWAKTFPSLSSHKKEYDQKIQEPSTDLPKAVKHQSPLPEFGGMCNKCGQKPKVPGNDGFCSDCSELG
ncbi:MAG: hypothetical protein EB101_11370 [Chitinophagia bacterium]|nr:hypothetical protein [Chitinophagia bacterium]